jgi:hypothetical protein
MNVSSRFAVGRYSLDKLAALVEEDVARKG